MSKREKPTRFSGGNVTHTEALNVSLEDLVLKYAVLNAVKFGGRAKPGPVGSKVLSERPELKSKVREVTGIVKRVVERVNSTSIDEQKRLLEERWGELLVEEKKKEERVLPPLSNVSKYPVVRTHAHILDINLILASSLLSRRVTRETATFSKPFPTLCQRRAFLALERLGPPVCTWP